MSKSIRVKVIYFTIFLFFVFSYTQKVFAETTVKDIPGDAAQFDNHFYKEFSTGYIEWEQAEKKCEELGGHLVTITSQEEFDFVLSLCKSTSEYWLGGTNRYTNGKWEWITGERWTFQKWNVGEPNNSGGNEYYLQLYNGIPAWNDKNYYGDGNVHGYICEWDEYTGHELEGKISQIKELQEYAKKFPKLSEADAKTFLGFIYNCDDYAGAKFDDDKFYKILIGDFSDYESVDELRIACWSFSSFVRNRMNDQIEDSAEKVERSSNVLIDILEKKLGGMTEESDAIIQEQVSGFQEIVKENMLDLVCGGLGRFQGIYITEDFLDNVKLGVSTYNQLASLPQKIEEYVDNVLLGVSATIYVLGNEVNARTIYFNTYLINRATAMSPDDLDFQIMMDYNKMAISENSQYAQLINYTTWFTGKDSWLQHTKDIERWAEYIYQLETHINSDSHDYVKTEIEPTCEMDGYTLYRCTRCNQEYKENIIKKLGHVEELRGAKEYNCDEDGYTGDVYCNQCHKYLSIGTVVEAKCDFLKKNSKVEAKCEESGEKEYWYCTKCNRCYLDCEGLDIISDNIEQWKVIPANGHNYLETWERDEKGHWHKCRNCEGKSIIETHQDINEDRVCDICMYNIHIHEGSKVNEVSSTCTTYGVKEFYKCVCGKVFKDVECHNEIIDLELWKKTEGKIEKKEHAYGEKWHMDESSHWHECTVCGDKQDIDKHTLKTVITKATLTANGKKETKCTVCDKVTKTTTIYYPKTFTLSKDKYIYDGKTKTPTLVVKDSKGKEIASTNYKITKPSERKNVGKYTYKVAFSGNYKGTKSVSFVINPMNTQISGLTPASKGFTVKWAKKTKQVDGYEVRYCTTNKFSSGVKKIEIAKNSTTSTKVTGLKASKVYYVQVRTYKTVNGKKFYSDWSKYEKVTTKK